MIQNNMYTFTLLKSHSHTFPSLSSARGSTKTVQYTLEVLITPQRQMTQTSQIWHVDVETAGAKLPHFHV